MTQQYTENNDTTPVEATILALDTPAHPGTTQYPDSYHGGGGTVMGTTIPEASASVLTENIPSELKALNQWLRWMWHTKLNGGKTKIPLKATRPGKASTVNPADWGRLRTLPFHTPLVAVTASVTSL